MEKIINKRIEWIDICKGFGILLVVIGHTGISKFSQISYDWIYSFHMPFFYMLSGLVFDEIKYNSFFKYIRRRIITLIIPFFILNTILFCIAKIINIDNIQPPISEIFTGVLAMYFLRVLFISEIYYFFINKLTSTTIYKLSIIAFVICISLYINKNFDLMFLKYIIPGMPLLYYSLGNIFKKNIKYYADYFNTNNLLFIAIVSFIFSICILRFNVTNVFTKIILAISGIITLLCISLLVSKTHYIKFKNAIIYIGMNTLVIVAFHQVIYNGLTIITKHVQLPTFVDSGIRMIFVWIILSVLCILFNKYFPLAIGKRNHIIKIYEK